MPSAAPPCTPFPWSTMVAIMAINFSQAIMVSQPFTIAVFMVRDFLRESAGPGMEIDEQTVSRMTAMLSAAYSFSQLVTSLPMGYLSNRVGRKPILLVGNAACFIGSLWFGLSSSYMMAVTAQMFTGSLNGIIGAWKCIIGESGDSVLQGRMFGYMTVSWGLGLIVGPINGGLMGNPCGRISGMPLCGKGQINYERPYFFVCFCTSLTILLSTLLTLIFLKETLPALMDSSGGHGSLMSSSAVQEYKAVDSEDPDQEVGVWKPPFVADEPLSRGPGHGDWDDAFLAGPFQESLSSELTPTKASLQPGHVGSHLGPEDRYPSVSPVDPAQLPAGPSSSIVHEAATAGRAGLWGRFSSRMGKVWPKGGSRASPAWLEADKEAPCMRESGSNSSLSSACPEGSPLLLHGLENLHSASACELVRSNFQPDSCKQGNAEHVRQNENSAEPGPPSVSALGKRQNTGDLVQLSESAGGKGGSVPVDKGAKEESWFRSRNVLLCICSYGLTVLVYSGMDETFPLYASAPRIQGGLDMLENQMSAPLSTFGAVLMAFSAWGYPPLQRRCGTHTLTRVGLLGSTLACFMLPTVATAQKYAHPVIGQVLLYSGMVLRAVAQTCSFNGAIIMVNAAPSPHHLGEVNGVGQALASLLRGVGPTVSGLLWAASLSLNTPGQQFLTWACIASVAVAACVSWGRVRIANLK